MFDYTDDEVDEKFYLSDSTIEYYEQHTKDNIENGLGFKFEPVERERESSNCKDNQNSSRRLDGRKLHQGILVANQGKTIVKTTDVACCLLARDCHGFGNQAMNGVIEYEL